MPVDVANNTLSAEYYCRPPSKPPCDSLQAQWSSEALPQHFDPEQGCAKFQMADHIVLDLFVFRQHVCYRETYQKSMSDVFSSIGGVLGFFLGGSVISLIQCGILGYKKSASFARSVGTTTRLMKRKQKQVAPRA